MSAQHRHCPACDATAARSIGAKNEHVLNACAHCGTLFAECEASAPADLYDDYYRNEQHVAVSSFMQTRMDEIVASFARYRATNRLLDVGFGGGAILDAAARAGWDVHGIEVSASAVEHARAHHPNVLQGRLEDAGYADAFFDVVIASELLEHLDNPTVFLAEILRILRPGGVLWATTPHGRGVSARLLGTEWSVVHPPDHLQLFSVHGAHALMRRAGFRRTRIRTTGADPLEIARSIRNRIRRTHEEAHRVNSLQPLNRVMIETRSGRTAKTVVNALLNATRLGDSLKILAEA